MYCEPDASAADRAATGWDQIPADWQWIPTGKPSPVGTARTVNNATLALIAAGQMTIPATKVSMSPDSTPATNPAPQIVHLPTLFWLDPKQFAEQQVTAQLAKSNLSATVTAVPEELDITVDGGAVYSTPASGGKPASGVTCLAKPDGSIGTAYDPANPTAVSDCSLTFLNRTPDNGTFTIHASLKWKLDWTAAKPGTGWPRQIYLTEDIPNITVKEVESINGG